MSVFDGNVFDIGTYDVGVESPGGSTTTTTLRSGAHGRKRDFQRFLDQVLDPVDIREEPAPQVSKQKPKHRIVKAKPETPKYTPPPRTWTAPPVLKVARPKPVTVYTPDFTAEWDEEDDIMLLLAA